MARKRKTAKARGQFSKKTKAQLYAWDNAVCAMTGASLWMLDYGATSLCHEDWADHVKPRARGGSHDRKNGGSLTDDATYEKSATGRSNLYAYIAGQPTWKAFTTFGKVPESTARFLRRDVLPRDWYFNRSLANLMWYVFGHVEGWTGTRIKKKPMHYPIAAFGFLEEFRGIWIDESDRRGDPTPTAVRSDWRKRGLLPTTLGEDQTLMLEVVNATSIADLVRIGKKLMPMLRRNERWIEKFDRWVARGELAAGQMLLRELSRDKQVTPYVRDVIKHNVHVLGGERWRPRDTGQRVQLPRRGADWWAD